MIPPKELTRLLNAISSSYPIHPLTEITIEANPEDVSKQLSQSWSTVGINRVSLGIQAVQDKFLNILKRKHSFSDVKKALKVLTMASIENINVDYIFALPGYTTTDARNDLQTLLKLPITHISTYELTIEPGTPFSQNYLNKRFLLPIPDTVAEVMEIIHHELESNNFRHYEVSNFALNSYESRHNMAYWTLQDYLGIGAGAHSFNKSIKEGVRSCNVANPIQYLKSLPLPTAWEEKLPTSILQYEYIMTGLRLQRGASCKLFHSFFQKELLDVFKSAITHFTSQGLLAYDSQFLKATEAGRMILDSILSDEIWDI
jgi:oxygen-independent coproporphyrinogen-3 oxidase